MARERKKGCAPHKASVLRPQGGTEKGVGVREKKEVGVDGLQPPLAAHASQLQASATYGPGQAAGRRHPPPSAHTQPASPCPWLGHRAFTSLSMQAALGSEAEKEAVCNRVSALYAATVPASGPSWPYLSHWKVFLSFPFVTFSHFFVGFLGGLSF